MNILLSNLQVKQLAKLCKECSDKMLSYYHSSLTVKQKSNDTPVTEADLAVSEILEKALPSIADYPVLSEENSPNNSQWKYWETYWLVDPIDGTKQFIKQTGEFCILIALIHRNQPVLGLVYSPIKSNGWFAQRCDKKSPKQPINSQQQYVNKIYCFETHSLNVRTDNAASIAITEWNRKLDSLPMKKAIISSLSVSEKMSELVGSIELSDFCSMGSGLKYIELVKGCAIIYPKMWPTCEWDTAAGHCLLNILGGDIINLDTGEPLSYGMRDSLINPHFVAFTELEQSQKNKLCETYATIKVKYELKMQ